VAARLGIYVDDVFHLDDAARVSTDRAFVLFACEVARHFERAVLFGRTVRSGAPSDYTLARPVELVALPHYPSLRHAGAVACAAGATVRAMWCGLERVDVVWVFGPHPFALVLVALALLRRKRVVLGVRQDTREYFRSRAGDGRSRLLTLAATALLDRAYRLLGRRLAATLVGPHVAAQYGGERPSNLVMTVSLVPASSLAERPRSLPATGPVRLLTVGRLEVEKNPLLVVELLAELERRSPGRYRLSWIGRGPLEHAVRSRAAELGVDALIDLRGYVAFGDELFALYRDADVFVHVSLTEGVPQVLVEALACATPVVATAVGGVPGLLEQGAAGLLVAPGDRDALVAAIERMTGDAALRHALVRRGLALAAELTLEAQSTSVATFIGTLLP
jgi:glycosyltransferase involved in cell wall biosynthesis